MVRPAGFASRAGRRRRPETGTVFSPLKDWYGIGTQRGACRGTRATRVIVYAPASSLGWLDLDAVASERVAALLRSLEEPGTLDELGLGTVRDALSGNAQPRHLDQPDQAPLLHLPALDLYPAGGAASSSGRLRPQAPRGRGTAHRLSPPPGAGAGVIGYNSGRDLKLMPSALYWGGLGAWGLRRLDLGTFEYGQRAAALRSRRPERDDDRNATTRIVSMWAPLPPPPDDFLDGAIDFELRAEEAQTLVDCIQRSQPGTLPAVLCGMPDVAADAEYPWDVPTGGMSDRLLAVLRHARCFSELTLGPQLVYNVLLARRAREEFGWDTHELEERQLRRLNSWTTLITDRHEVLRSWVENIPEFWHFLAGHRIGGATQDFINSVAGRAVADPGGFAEDPVVHTLISRREVQLKGKRARLAHRGALENWSQVAGGGQLDYRWPITKSYLADLDKALEATP